MARLEGLEPSTSWAVTKHSVQLSYKRMEAPTGLEPVIKVLQTYALPFGYGAIKVIKFYYNFHFVIANFTTFKYLF